MNKHIIYTCIYVCMYECMIVCMIEYMYDHDHTDNSICMKNQRSLRFFAFPSSLFNHIEAYFRHTEVCI